MTARVRLRVLFTTLDFPTSILWRLFNINYSRMSHVLCLSRSFCIATLLTVSRHSWVTFYDFVEYFCSNWKVAFGKHVHRNELPRLVRGSRSCGVNISRFCVCFMCVTWPAGSRLHNKMSRGVGLLSQVSILYFAKSAELTGVKDEEIPVPTPVSSQQLWGLLLGRHPRCCPFLLQHMCTFVFVCTPATYCRLVCRLSVLQGQVVLAVRQQYIAIDDQPVALGDGDEVAVVPPLSGG